MSSIKTEYGRNWVVNRILHGDEYGEISHIVVGSGDSDPVETDTELEAQEYEASVSDTNANIYKLDDIAGTYRADITLTGGVEVDDGTPISELGIKTEDGSLIYREVRSNTVISSGERISFEIEAELINV